MLKFSLRVVHCRLTLSLLYIFSLHTLRMWLRLPERVFTNAFYDRLFLETDKKSDCTLKVFLFEIRILSAFITLKFSKNIVAFSSISSIKLSSPLIRILLLSAATFASTSVEPKGNSSLTTPKIADIAASFVAPVAFRSASAKICSELIP